MAPYAITVRDIGLQPLKQFRRVLSTDAHNIQTHSNNIDTLVGCKLCFAVKSFKQAAMLRLLVQPQSTGKFFCFTWSKVAGSAGTFFKIEETKIIYRA